MKKHKNIFLYVLLIVLGFNAIYSYMKISDLEGYIQNTRNYLENSDNALRNNINRIYNNVDEQMKKEASYLSHFEMQEGTIDTSTHTVKVDLEVIPKEVNSQTKLTLQYKDKKYPFTRDGDTFTISFPCDLFDSYDNREYAFVRIENNGQTKIEKLEDLDLYALYERYLPYMVLGNFTECEHSKDKTIVHLDASLHIPAESEGYDVRFKEFYLVTVINGKMSKEYMTTKIKDSESYHDGVVHFSKKVELNASSEDQISICFEAVDTLGYIHQFVMYENSEEFNAAGSGNEIILDQNGVKLIQR